MSQEERLEIDNLFTKLGDLRSESIIFRAEDFNLGLKIGEPLLLPLSAFQRSDPTVKSVADSSVRKGEALPISFQEVFPLLLVGHLLVACVLAIATIIFFRIIIVFIISILKCRVN